MDWLEVVTVAGLVVVTLVGCGALGVRFVWRKTESVRKESQAAHEKIGEKLDKVRDDLSTEIGQVKDGLRAEIGPVRDGLNQVRGELKGVNRELTNLREDFRAHGVDRQAT